MRIRILTGSPIRTLLDRALAVVRNRDLLESRLSRWISVKRPAPAILLGLVLTIGAVLILEFWPGPSDSGEESAALVFLIPVLVASILGGWVVGACIAVVAAAAWNWYFLPPASSLGASPAGWFTLAFFVVVGTVVGVVPLLVQHLADHKRVAGAVQESEQRYRAFFDLNVVGAAETDLVEGRYLQTNDAYCQMLGYSRDELRSLRFVDVTHPDDRDVDLREFDRLARGEIPSYRMEKRYIRKDGRIIWGQLAVTLIRNSEGDPISEVGLVVDVTEHKRAEEELQRLSGRLLQAQDEERRRIAQELHDQTAQSLVASNLNLSVLLQTQAALDEQARSLVRESLGMGQELLKEIRTLSYLLHPPLLDELGLAPALEWYVDGFRKRSGIEVELIIPQDLERLSRDVETAMYRVVQECLTNIHRHAPSQNATIRVVRERGQIILEVMNRGGRTPTVAGRGNMTEGFGVGTTSMRQRVTQLGGRLEITSHWSGTTVTAVLPSDPEARDPLSVDQVSW
jgi:PAS domain S-box-containing protein